MSIKHFLLTLFVITCVSKNSVQAQVERAFHQVIPTEEAYILNFLVDDNFEVITWSGSTILVEGMVHVDCCDPNMLLNIIKTGRYHLKIETEVDVLSLVSAKRPPLTIKGKMCNETVKIKISIPETYALTDKKQCILIDSPLYEAKKH